MDATIVEIAQRAWLFAEGRLNEINEKDTADQEIGVEDSRLRQFIINFQAGSLYLDLFQPSEVRKLVNDVFTSELVQAFVFDLQWHATVGIDRDTINAAISSIANTLSPGFQKPSINGFDIKITSELVKALQELEFEDHKWTLTVAEIEATLRYLPWMVPLMLISVGALVGGVVDGGD